MENEKPPPKRIKLDWHSFLDRSPPKFNWNNSATNEQRIKLETRSKAQDFPIEVIFSRFSHLTEQIFDNLNDVGLTNCSEVSRQWKNYLEAKRFFQIRIIRSKMSTDGKVGKSWEEFFKASNTKTIKYMADSVKYVKCDKSFAPIHIPAHGRSSFYRVLLLLLVWPYGLH
jgi:hypothetical protein